MTDDLILSNVLHEENFSQPYCDIATDEYLDESSTNNPLIEFIPSPQETASKQLAAWKSDGFNSKHKI